MAEFKNEFSWSISRAKMFRECLRKYYYSYYGSWNGWTEEGSPYAKLCYRLKQIVDLPTWAGDIVHRAIETALRRWRRGQIMSREAMQSLARNMLNNEWKESAEGLWLRHPKKYRNLFEHYYSREVSAEDRSALRQKVFDSLQAFEEMGWARELRSLPPDDWLTVEELLSFPIAETKVWVVIDCAFRRGAETVIYDWKTGAAAEEDTASDQLICYALFAATVWGASLDSLRLSPVYLAERSAPRHTVSAEQVIGFRERAFQSVKEMREHLADPVRNLAREEAFPRTTETSRCQRCGFFEVCYGDRSLIAPQP